MYGITVFKKKNFSETNQKVFSIQRTKGMTMSRENNNASVGFEKKKRMEEIPVDRLSVSPSLRPQRILYHWNTDSYAVIIINWK